MAANSRTASLMRDAGAVTFVIGLIFAAVGVEALAVYNACAADPVCLPDASALNVGVFCAMLAVGIALAVAGAWATGDSLSVGRIEPTREPNEERGKHVDA